MLLAHVLCALVGASVATRGLRVSLFAAVCARSVWGRTPHQCPYLPSDCRSLLLLVAIPLGVVALHSCGLLGHRERCKELPGPCWPR